MFRLIFSLLPVALAVIAQGIIANKGLPLDAEILYGASIALFVWVLSRDNKGQLERPNATHLKVIDMLRYRSITIPAGLCLLLFSASVGIWAYTKFLSPLSNLGLVFFLLSVTFAFLAIRAISRIEPKLSVSTARVGTVELLVLVGIILIGVFMRVHQLVDLPEGVWYDEADSALEALQTDAGFPYSPAAFRYRGNPSAYYYFVYLGFEFIGVNLFSIRFITAAFGILTIPAVFVLGKLLFGRYVALLAAFFIAVSRWNVDFSRFGMHNISAPLLEVMMLFFLLRALKWGRWADYATAGLLLGLGMHTYTAFKIVPFIPVLIVLREIVFERDYLRTSYQKIALCVVAAALTFAPMGIFAVQSPNEFFQRLGEASVFAGKNTFNEQIQALGSNIVKHALMFNVQGDGNGRHNLPGTPMLDFYTSAFFVLGVGYSLFKVRRREYSAVMISLVVGLLAGILSLDFEAPQGARTIIITPIISIIAAIPLGLIVGRYLEQLPGLRVLSRQKLRLILPVGVAGIWLLASIGLSNYQTYFDKQAKDFSVWSSFSGPETLIAREANVLGPGYDFYIADFYFDQPTLRFLSPWLKNYEMVKTSHIFPIETNGDRPIAIFFDAQKSAIFDLAKQYYPDAVLKTYKHPYSGIPVLYSALISRGDIARIQGLEADYFANVTFEGTPVKSQKESNVNSDWKDIPPLPLPFGVQWEGILNTPEYGRYLLGVEAPGQALLFVDGNEIVDSGKQKEASLVLAKGNHSIAVKYVAKQKGEVSLYWQRPGKSKEQIPGRYLYTAPVTDNGLLGSYFANANWSGSPAFEQIDPAIAATFHIIPLPRPYSVLWKGNVYAPKAGTYGFRIDLVGDVSLLVDGKTVVQSKMPSTSVTGRTELTQGFHEIQLKYLDNASWSRISLLWSVPGQGVEILPSRYLYPPRAKMEPPSLPIPVTRTEPPVIQQSGPSEFNQMVSSETGKFVFSIGQPGQGEGQFLKPRDVAEDSKGNLYIVDAGNHRVQKFARDGNFIGKWGREGNAEGEFQEPVGIVIDKDDNVFVLDSQAGWVTRFDTSGKVLGRFGGTEVSFYHPRGIGLDTEGHVFVADTGRSRIVWFDRDGRIVEQVGVKGSGNSELLEPTDMAYDGSGKQAIVDMGNNRIVLLDGKRNFLGSWDIPFTNTANSTHVAFSNDGSLYLTVPERNLVQQRSLDGRILSEWGGLGSDHGQFRLPSGIFVDGRGNLFVVDTFNDRVEKFELPGAKE